MQPQPVFFSYPTFFNVVRLAVCPCWSLTDLPAVKFFFCTGKSSRVLWLDTQSESKTLYEAWVTSLLYW